MIWARSDAGRIFDTLWYVYGIQSELRKVQGRFFQVIVNGQAISNISDALVKAGRITK